MKDFQDFIEQIDLDEYHSIVVSAKQSLLVSGKQEEDAYAFFIAMKLLERYHNWVHLN